MASPFAPFIHAARLCGCGCGEKFTPIPTLSPTSTETYIDGHHALRAYLTQKGVDYHLPAALTRDTHNAGPMRRGMSRNHRTSQEETMVTKIAKKTTTAATKKSTPKVAIGAKVKYIGRNEKYTGKTGTVKAVYDDGLVLTFPDGKDLLVSFRSIGLGTKQPKSKAA